MEVGQLTWTAEESGWLRDSATRAQHFLTTLNSIFLSVKVLRPAKAKRVVTSFGLNREKTCFEYLH